MSRRGPGPQRVDGRPVPVASVRFAADGFVTIEVDRDGLVVSYPGIAERVDG